MTLPVSLGAPSRGSGLNRSQAVSLGWPRGLGRLSGPFFPSKGCLCHQEENFHDSSGIASGIFL